MKKKFSLKKLGAIGGSALLALSLSFGLAFSNLTPNGAKETDSAAVDSETVQTVEQGNKLPEASTYALNSNYGALINGGAYAYSDVSKIVNYRGGKVDSDITSHRVTYTDSNHGSADNPFVINTVEQWNYFAGDTANATNANRVFVLGADLNFSGKTFKPVPNLSAKFYGGNHILSNITYAFSTSLTTGAGCFQIVAQTAAITDLSLDNVTFTGVTNWGGFIAGRSTASILNCHVRGKLTGSSTSGYGIGGIVGNVQGNTARTYIYRCSVFADFTLGVTTYGGVGAICGDVDSGSGASAYDCFSICNYSFTGSYAWFGGVLNSDAGGAATHEIVNCVAYSNVKDTTPMESYRAYGSLFNGWGDSVTWYAENTYTAGYVTGTKTHDMYSGAYWNSGGGNTGKVSGAKNVNWYAASPNFWQSGSSMLDLFAHRGYTTTRWNGTGTNTRANMWTAAKNNTALNSKIWVNKSVITDAYMTNTNVNSTTGYTIANSPVRTRMNTIVSYADTSNTLLTLSPNKNPVEYTSTSAGTALPVPATSPTGKKFLGWALQKVNPTTIYTTFPDKLYGNVTMYPVWGMTNVTVSTAAEVDEHNGEVKDKIVTAKYIGEEVVTLTASVNLPCAANDCKIEWSWFKKEGEEEVKLAGKTTNVLTLTELTNATYYAKVKLTNTKESWYTEADVKSNEFDVTIEKGALSPSGGISLAEKVGEGDQAKDVFAYWGQPLSELQDLVVAPMQNTAGLAVAGTITWDDPLTKVGDTQKTYEAYFHPTDKTHYEDNTPVSVTILPTILQWKFEFAVNPQVDNVVFTFSEEYGKTYTRAQVAQRFEDTYFDWLNDIGEDDTRYAEMVGRTPYFGTEDITQYRGTNAVGAYFDSEHVADNGYIIKDKTTNSAVLNTPVAFNALNKSTMFTISLFREEQTNGTLANTTQQLGYGAKIAKPLKSLHMDGSTTQYLEGWFVTNASGEVLNTNGGVFTGAEGEERVSWDFATARVTGHTFLGAVWKDGFLKLTSIYASVNGGESRTFTARTLAKPTDFIVVGVYSVYEDESMIKPKGESVELVLSSEDYTVSAEGTNTGTTEYHVGAIREAGKPQNYAVTITSKANHELDYTIAVTVVAKRLDMSGINFPNKSVQYKENETQRIGDASQEVAVALAPQGVQDGDFTISYLYYDSSNQLLNTNEGVKSIGLYYVYLQLNFNTSDFTASRVSATFTITAQPIVIYVEWNADNKKEYTYNGQIQHPEANFYTKNEAGERTPVTVTFVYTGNSEQKIANADGVYSSIGVELRNARYQLAEDAVTSIEFRINRAKVRLPQLANNSFEFKNDLYDISDYIGYDADTLEFLVEVRNGTAKDVPNNGTITSQVRLRDAINSEWEDGSSSEKQIIWTITAKVMTVPTFTETLVYTGLPFKIAEHLNFYDPVITLFGSEIEATNAGIYRANLRLPTENGGKNYVWDKKDFNGTVDWQIQKAELYLTWDAWSYLYNGNTHSPRAQVAYGLVDADAALQSVDPRLIYTGDADKREAGSYKIVVTIGQTSELYKNYTLAKDSATFFWVVKESADEVVITVVWDMPVDGGYTYNGEIQYPKIKALYSENSMGEEDLENYNITYTGDWNKAKYRGTYTVGVEITSVNNTPLRIRQGEASYVIRRNAAGEGEDPDAGKPTTPDNPSNPGNTGDPAITGTIESIPQVIISGVALVLILVFGIMTLNYASAANNAKRKAKKLAQMSYSFAPVALLAPLLGMSDGNWWIVAGVLLGVALMMAVVMFLFRSKSKKALLLLEEEEERIEEEKEAARQDREAAARAEQQRRDDEFKMMFAAMQQNQQNYQQSPIGYDDMRSMLAETVAGLLPTMQQQLQALPPAQSETDDLRNLMAQQQEMLNQLMENQQNAQAAYSQFGGAQQGEDYAELKRVIAQQEEMINRLTKNNNDESNLTSLEEAYNHLDAEARKLYYEIGGFIMNKPDMAQTDGKYAVLFKYRSNPVFKICIKNNHPTLMYSMDNFVVNSTDGTIRFDQEVAIRDNEALEVAKNIVNLRIHTVDRELDR